jgi:two-component system chemotaxis response regulator CheB
VKKDIIVIGASAGGVEVLTALVAGLPADLQASVFIVLHVGASDPSILASILQNRSKLPVTEARDGEAIRKGHVYVARPDYHLLVEADTIALARGPKENRSRPAIDALFRSACHAHGPRVIGVVLTGMLDDGSSGLWWVKKRGGTAIVQDPEDAQAPSMPRHALAHVQADHVVPASAIPALLARLSREEAIAAVVDPSQELETEVAISREGRALQLGVMELGPITRYTCPECHGCLVALKSPGVRRFRCHTGHAYSINTLLAEVTEFVGEALWTSIRAIEESAMLLDQMARELEEKGGQDPVTIGLLHDKSRDTLRRADTVRQVAISHQTLSQDNLAEVERTER